MCQLYGRRQGATSAASSSAAAMSAGPDTPPTALCILVEGGELPRLVLRESHWLLSDLGEETGGVADRIVLLQKRLRLSFRYQLAGRILCQLLVCVLGTWPCAVKYNASFSHLSMLIALESAAANACMCILGTQLGSAVHLFNM
jgi:hypothetical protein